MTIHTLHGCAPVPLAHYLKALGILRLVSEQRDPDASGFWRHEAFELSSSLDREALTRFFLEEYRPSPVLAPWNGGSGFYKKDNTTSITAIESSAAPRFDLYRLGISLARKCVSTLGLTDKPTEQKEDLLQLCRNEMPDSVLEWLDAVFVIGKGGAKYPPLLGTGGNDGRLEFTNNFMQRLLEVIDPATGTPTPNASAWLRSALFADNIRAVGSKAPVGQFFPGAAGGPNATSGFDAPSAVNPWDYILMIEGALLFAASTVKKLESHDQGQLMYPFCVRQTGVGYGSASLADESAARAEMWMPLWKRHTTYPELQAIFSEGRAQVGGRPARNGVDFTRAVVTLGVDRGLSAFQRYGFQLRNGLAYFATPLERVAVERNARADLLTEIDPWMDRLRTKAGPQANPPAPASVARAFYQLESRIQNFCKIDSAKGLQAVLIALGSCERAMARSGKWTREAFLPPAPLLTPQWLWKSDDNSSEFKLAASLASLTSHYQRNRLPLRCHLEQVSPAGNREKPFFRWLDNPSNNVVWHEGRFHDVLNEIFARQLVLASQSGEPLSLQGRVTASLADIAKFIDQETDDVLLSDLLWGLSLINWDAVRTEDEPASGREVPPSSLYALLKLCFVPMGSAENPAPAVPLVPAIHRRAWNGDWTTASELAIRRLRASGFSCAVKSIPPSRTPSERKEIAQRTAAALLFPITQKQTQFLTKAILHPKTTIAV